MASAPPSPPPGTPPPPPVVGLPGEGVPAVVAQINGTFARVQSMLCTSADPGNNPYAKVLLEDAYERMRQHATGEAPLHPEDSLALRKEIDRLSELVYGKQPGMSAAYSAGERAVLAERAERARRAANSIGIAAGGPVLAGLPMLGRVLGAPEAAVENLAEINLNLAGPTGVRTPRAPRLPAQPKPVASANAPLRADKPPAQRRTPEAKKEPASPPPPPPPAAPAKPSTAVKKLSARLRYLGRTPGKDSKTGKEVIERLKNKKPPEVREGKNGLEFKDPNDGKWYPIKDADMAHFPRNAVDYWNQEGILHGPLSPQVRQWMLDPSNYRLEHFSFNRSAGAALGTVYKVPPGG